MRKKYRPVLILAGTIFIFIAFYYFLMSHNAKSWPKAEGKIVYSSVLKESQVDPWALFPFSYTPEVEYIYKVDGRIYRSHNISISDYGMGLPFHATKLINDNPVGKKVIVSHNPANPNDALLEPGDWSGALPYIIIGLLCMTVAWFKFLWN